MSFRRMIMLLILAATATAFAQTPLPIAERFSTRRNETTRVSLFSSGAVVVTIQTNGVQGFMRHITLPHEQYVVYLGSFVTNATELEEEPVISDVETSAAEVTVILHVGPDAPRIIRFSPMSSVSLPMARIMGAFDDLQEQGMTASPSAEAMRTWEPQRRDRVELLNGTFAIVKEVWPDGMIVLEHESTYIREMVPQSQRDKVIRRVVEDDN